MTQPDRSTTRWLHMKATQNQIPLSGTFELSPVCNLACKMCYVRKTPAEVAAHDRPMLRLDQWKRIGDEALDAGMLFLLLTGGEPFLWPDFRELCGYLHRKGAILSINTNGTLITDDVVSWLLETPPARLNITLYGASDEAYQRLCGVKGVYRKVAENIDRLLQKGFLVKLNASLTPSNASDLEGIVRFAKERDLLLEASSYMFPPIRRDASSVGTGARFTPEEAAKYSLLQRKLRMKPEDYQTLLGQIVEGVVPPPGLDECCVDAEDGRVRCSAGRSAFWVTWDGYMLPCGMVPEPKADVAAMGFASAWKKTLEATAAVQLSGVCETCTNKKVCHSCMAMALAETGTHSGIPKYLCSMAASMRQQALAELPKLS